MGGVTSSVASKMAFFPPDPPSYGVVDEEDEDAACNKVATTRRVAMTGVRWSVGARRQAGAQPSTDVRASTTTTSGQGGGCGRRGSRIDDAVQGEQEAGGER